MTGDGQPPIDRARANRLMRLATIAAVSTASVLIAAKLAAWILSNSVAVLSTLLDSLLDLVASLVTFLAIRQAIQPADREHRFGHGKAEALAGLAQAAFVAGSALLLMVEVTRRFLDPRPVTNEFFAIAVMVFTIAATLALVAFQRHVMRKTGSIAITADSLHYAGDLLINGGVMAALVIGLFWSWPYLDPIFAAGVGGYLLYNAAKIGRESLDMLMDRELPEEERERIKAIVLAHPAARAMHDLRSRRSGFDTFIQFHLELDPSLSLIDAHLIADEVEARIREMHPNAEVIIHQDPEGYMEDHPPLAAH